MMSQWGEGRKEEGEKERLRWRTKRGVETERGRGRGERGGGAGAWIGWVGWGVGAWGEGAVRGRDTAKQRHLHNMEIIVIANHNNTTSIAITTT